MAIYKYVGRTRQGKMKKGTVEAINKANAVVKLREMGISPREITETRGILYQEVTLGNPVKQQDFVIYCRQFATLIRSGISIVDATNILARQTESKMLAKVLSAVEERLRSGVAFSEAIAEHPKVFPAIFVNMVRAGEMTGNLDGTLDRLASYLEKQYNLKKKIQSTMAYPIVLLIVIIAVDTFLMLTIVPNFESMFASLGSELPAITKFVLNVSNFLQQSWLILSFLVIAMVIIFQFLMRTNETFNYQVHVALLKMPVFGKLLQKSAIARMARTLSSMVSSSVPILQALTMVEKVVGNPVLGKVIIEARDHLEQGDRLSEPMKKSWLIPPLVSQMIAIGEETGQLDFMLAKIADFYEEEVDRTVDTLKSLIEPIMIIILAFIVGTIILAIMIPMFTYYQHAI